MDIAFVHQQVGRGAPSIGDNYTAKFLTAAGVPSLTYDNVVAAMQTRPKAIVLDAGSVVKDFVMDVCFTYPYVKVIINNHTAMWHHAQGVWESIKQYLYLSEDIENLYVGFVDAAAAVWAHDAFADKVIHTQYLVPSSAVATTMPRDKESLHVGILGQLSVRKNQWVAAVAAGLMSKQLNRHVTVHINTDRGERAEDVKVIRSNILDTTYSMGCKVVEHSWEPWPVCLRVLSGLDIMFNVSFAESYGLIVAEGITCGIPSVISPNVPCGPDRWKVWHVNDPYGIAKKGISLLEIDHDARMGKVALEISNMRALAEWRKVIA